MAREVVIERDTDGKRLAPPAARRGLEQTSTRNEPVAAPEALDLGREEVRPVGRHDVAVEISLDRIDAVVDEGYTDTPRRESQRSFGKARERRTQGAENWTGYPPREVVTCASGVATGIAFPQASIQESRG